MIDYEEFLDSIATYCFSPLKDDEEELEKQYKSLPSNIEYISYFNINGGEFYAGSKEQVLSHLNSLFDEFLDHECCSVVVINMETGSCEDVKLTF